MSVVDTAKIAYDLAKKGMTLELQGKVMQLREEALELQEENLRLKQENLKLQGQIELQETVHFRRKVYWRDSDEVPFCPYCYEKHHALIHLSRWEKWEQAQIYICQECQTRYGENPTAPREDFTVSQGRRQR